MSAWVKHALLSAAIVVGAGAFVLYSWIRVPEPPAVDYPAPRDVADAHRQDLDYLSRTMQLDRSFPARERAAFLAELADTQAQAATLDAAQFEMKIAHAVAHAHNGHTNSRGVSMGRNLPVLPLRFAWFEEGLFVVRASPSLVCALGARVVAIDGRSPEALLKSLRRYVGGTGTLAKLVSVNFLVAPAALHAAGDAARPDQVRVAFADSSCGGHELVVAANAPAPVTSLGEERWPVRDLSPVTEPDDRTGWRHVLSQPLGELPLYLQRPDERYWRVRAGKEMLYVHIRRVRNLGRLQLDEFADQTLDEIARDRPRFVVVDLRASPGGDADLLLEFSRRLPAMLPPDGRVFVLVGPNTFSAAIIAAARLKHFGGAKTVLVGDDMADGGQFWADGGRAILPNSRIPVSYAHAFHDWSNGCSLGQIRTCYWQMYFFGVAAGDLAPEVRVPQRFSAYAAGRDPVMETVRDLASARTLRSTLHGRTTHEK